MPRAHTALIIYLSIRLLLVTLCRFLLTLQRLQMTIFLLAVVQILFRLAKVWGNITQRENDSRDNFILFTIGLNYNQHCTVCARKAPTEQGTPSCFSASFTLHSDSFELKGNRGLCLSGLVRPPRSRYTSHCTIATGGI